jgi:hypothetical protein
MTTVYVAFTDGTKTAVSSYFTCSQNLVAWPNQGEMETSDPIWRAFYIAQPGWMQAALPDPD